MLAALNLGHFGVKVHASDDDGATWHEVATPAYPPQPEGAEGVPWKLVQIWSLAAGARHALGRHAAGRAVPLGRLRPSWQLVESLWSRPERAEWFGGGYDVPGIHSICPHPQRAGRSCWWRISCGGVWVTRDDGARLGAARQGHARRLHAARARPTTRTSQDPHRVVRCAAAPDVLWCQHHNGIWRSTDNAARWQEVTTAPLSNFGFAVAVHPGDPQTAWFVPGAGRRAARAGRRRARRQPHARRRRAASRRCATGCRSSTATTSSTATAWRSAADGRTLLMGSTTGGLWASSDGGEHWQTVSSTLPPIYAVRFG